MLATILTLRSLGVLFGLQGQPKAAQSLGLLADGLESGANVDAHMAAVATALKSGSSLDWADVHARITADSARLQG
jgi:ribulose kinase